MNEFRPTSKLTRAVAAAAALFSTVMVVSAVVGLSEYYTDKAVVATTPAATSVASR